MIGLPAGARVDRADAPAPVVAPAPDTGTRAPKTAAAEPDPAQPFSQLDVNTWRPGEYARALGVCAFCIMAMPPGFRGEPQQLHRGRRAQPGLAHEEQVFSEWSGEAQLPHSIQKTRTPSPPWAHSRGPATLRRGGRG